MVQIRLFGGVSATTDGGVPIDVGPAKCQAVLAVLALSVGSVVPVSRMVDLVWGDQPPRTAAKNLQSYVTHLRKGVGADAIVRAGAAYRLDVDADAVDVSRFQRRLEAGDIEAALAEWTGTPLAGLDAEGLTPTVDGLVEQWLGATERHLARRIDTDAPTTIGRLTELTADHPFREEFWALLMTALYRAGRQADALAAYAKARHHLVEELGVEPGPRLRELESLILAQDQRLSAERSSPGAASDRPTGTVTFGFCDVDGTTGLWATHRHQTAAALGRVEHLLRTAVDDHAGSIFASGDESFGVAFHRAGDAAAWATQLQTAMADQSWPDGIELQLRIGLHTGEVAEQDNGFFGPAVHDAARLATAGHGGQTLVSGVTEGLLDGDSLHDLGVFRLDGAVAEQRILQLGNDQHPPLRTQASRRGNLPRRLGRLIGRDQDLEAVGDALATAPVVTLVGPGGIGKTRLALAAARSAEADHPGGAWLVELAGIASSNEVARAVADTLDVKEHPRRTLTESILTVLQSRHVLLVLDNCEHVIDGAAELTHAIAEACPNIRVLATSREGLAVVDERLIAVAPLEPTGPAIELFNERALARSPTFDRDANRDDVEEICRRLDGVPLAIELAAARTTSLAPPDLLERLDDRLRLLTGGRRAGVERHRTLRATIQWSYDLLTQPEQVLFQRLSIFAGPFDLLAAETVAADAALDVASVDDLLGGLVERSMLHVESGPFGRHFRWLETIRQFAAEHLFDSGNTDLVAQRHANWCLDEVTNIHQLINSSYEIEGVARLSQLWTNLRAAVDWACATADRRLAHALVKPVAPEILLRSHGEIYDWIERLLDITPPDDEELIVFGLTWAAHRYMQNRDHQAYERLAERHGEPDHPMVRYARAFVTDNNELLVELAPQAVVELRRQGEDYLAGLAQIWVGGALLGTGRWEEHDALVTTLADRYRVHGPPTLLNWTLVLLGYSALFQGNHAQADQFFHDSASIDVPDNTPSLNRAIQARAALRRGNPPEAFQILRSFVEELLDNDTMSGAGLTSIEFVNMMVEIDRLPDAARILGYLDGTGLLDVEAASFRTLVADAAHRIANDDTHPHAREQAIGKELDDRHALAYIRDVLDRLLDDGPNHEPRT